MTDHDKFKNVTTGIQSLIVSIAFVIGGLWTIYTFGVLQDVISLDLRIEAQQIISPLGDRPVVLVTVTAQNNGSRSITLDLSQEPLLIQKVVTHESGRLIATKTWKPSYYVRLSEKPDVYIFSASQEVQAKSTKKICFYQELEAPGIYFVAFSVPFGGSSKSRDPEINKEEATAILGGKFAKDVWGTATYFSVVKPDRLAAAPAGRRPQPIEAPELRPSVGGNARGRR